MNTDPRHVRKDPVRVPRPGAPDATTEARVETGLHETATGGTLAVGLEGMLALSMSMGSTRPRASTPPAGDES